MSGVQGSGFSASKFAASGFGFGFLGFPSEWGISLNREPVVDPGGMCSSSNPHTNSFNAALTLRSTLLTRTLLPKPPNYVNK